MTRRFLPLLFLLTMICSVSAWAQNNVGRITGTVTDSGGAVLPGAQVTAVNTQTAAPLVTVTDGSGFYAFPSLPAGTYSITVMAQGFSSRKEEGIVLDAASVHTTDFTMSAGAATEQVTITANAQQVDTSSAQVGSTIDGRQLENIALNGRNPIQMLRLLPGTVATTLDPFTVNVGATAQQVNGVRGASMMMMIDGIANLDNGGNTSVRAITNPDSISEMRVLTASYSAEYYGRAAAVMNVITKSGTNTFHGSVFEFVRNQMFDADSYFFVPAPGVNKTPLHFNDYGYTIGGPLYIPGKFNVDRKKLFFFADQEWRSSHVGATNLDTIPTTAQLNGDFSAVAATTIIIDPQTHAQASCNGVLNVICPSRLSPNGAALLSVYKNLVPNTGATGANNYSVTRTNIFDSREDRVNVDYVRSEKIQMGARWTQATNYQGQGFFEGNLGIGTGAFPRPAYLYSGYITHAFSPTLVNSMNFGASHNVLRGTPYNTAVLRSTLGLTYTEAFPTNLYSPAAAPNFNLTGFTGYTAGSLANKSLRDLQFNDDITKVLGKHVVKAGFLFMQSNDTEPKLSQGSSNGIVTFGAAQTSNPTATGTVPKASGSAVASALYGTFASYSEDQTGGFFASHYTQYEMYLQDSWKVNQRLTLNYGARYLLYPTNTNPYNNNTLFDPRKFVASQAPGIIASGVQAGAIDPTKPGNPYNGLVLLGTSFSEDAKKRFPTQTNDPAVLALFNGLPQGGAPMPKGNFAPRIGIAFDPRGDGKTAIRAGFGGFYDHLSHYLLSLGALQPPFDKVATVLGAQNAIQTQGATIDAPSAGSSTFPSTIYSLPLKYKSPVVYTANFDVQQQLPRGIITDIAYVGTFGRHLYRITNINQPLAGAVKPGVNRNTVRPYQGYDDIAQVDYADNSNYHSLQATVSKRTRNGLSFSASYTWSKALDTSTQPTLYGQFPQDSRNIAAEYGLSDIHRGQVVTMNAVWNLPFFKNSNMLAKTTLGGWTVSTVFLAQSGAPNNIIVTNDPGQIGSVFAGGAGANSAGPAYERAQQVGNPNIPKGSRSARGNWFDPTAFTAPAATGAYNNVRRNSLIGPGFNSFDSSLYKHFKFMERYDFEFRAEGFNVINHPSFSGVGNVVGTPTFGKITGAGPGRVLQFGAKLTF